MKNVRAGISDKPQGPSVEFVVFWSMMPRHETVRYLLKERLNFMIQNGESFQNTTNTLQ